MQRARTLFAASLTTLLAVGLIGCGDDDGFDDEGGSSGTGGSSGLSGSSSGRNGSSSGSSGSVTSSSSSSGSTSSSSGAPGVCTASAGLGSVNGCPEFRQRCGVDFTFPNADGITEVELRGNYGGDATWAAGNLFTLDGDTWKVHVDVKAPVTFQYKFIIRRDGQADEWITDPANPTQADGNSVKTVDSCEVPTCAAAPDPLCATPPGAPADGAFDWRDSVMYFAFVDRFMNGDATNDAPIITDAADKPGDYLGGDYRGLITKLEEGYFDTLGVNTLWVSVPFDNPDLYQSPTNETLPDSSQAAHPYTGYHGYWPLDQWPENNASRVEEHFGTEAELVELVTKAHARGIKILFDYAMVHVHEDSPVYADHPDWFTPKFAVDEAGAPIYVDSEQNVVAAGTPGATQLECLCNSNVTTPTGVVKPAICNYDGTAAYPTIGQRCWFQGYLPHWDYSNQDAVDYSVDAAIRLARDTGVDGYRLDAVKHIKEAWYTTMRARMNDELAANGSAERFYLVGETYDFGNRAFIKGFVDPATKLDGQFDFPMRAQLARAVLKRGSGMTDFASFMDSNDGFYGCNAVMSTWIGNHDVGRPIHIAEDTPLWDEYANAADRSWANQPTLPANDAPFERLANAFGVLFTNPGAPLIYYGDEFGMAGGGDPDNRRMLFDTAGAVTLTAQQQALDTRIKQLTAIRKAHPALRRGLRTTLAASADVWAYSMTSAEETVTVVLNRGDTEQTFCDLPTGPLRELIEAVDVDGPGTTVPPRQLRVFVAR